MPITTVNRGGGDLWPSSDVWDADVARVWNGGIVQYDAVGHGAREISDEILATFYAVWTNMILRGDAGVRKVV